jgi:HSP20 family molecular chaperone IbpA
MNPKQTPPMGASLIIGGPGSRAILNPDVLEGLAAEETVKSYLRTGKPFVVDFSSVNNVEEAMQQIKAAFESAQAPSSDASVDERIAKLDKQQAERQTMKKTEQKKVDTDNFVWFNPEFTFSVIPGSDGKFRTRVPVPGCDVKDVTVTQTGNKVEVKSQLKLKDAHCTNVAVGTIPVGHKLKSTTLKEGLLTLLTETVTPDLSETRKIPVRAVRSTNGYSHY